MNPTTNTEAGAVADVAAKPVRVQLRRTKGWRMPANTVKVDRTTRWGNDFVMAHEGTRDRAVESFRTYATGIAGELPSYFEALRGKNLACWCREGLACHADVLLELANAPVRQHLEQGATAGGVEGG